MENTQQNPIISTVFLVAGLAMDIIQDIAQLNVILEFVLKITSLISFGIFLILNYNKIKDAYQKWRFKE